MKRIEAELGAEAVMGRCGSALGSQAAGPKIAWIAEEEPELYARARRLYMPSSWLVRRLTGSYVLDHHSASQCTPLYDTHAQEWYRPWADQVAPGIELPPLRWSAEAAGTVTLEAARATGLPAGIPVVTGTVERPPVLSRDGARELYAGAPLPHFNEVDEGVAVDSPVTNRIRTAMGLDPATTLHGVSRDQFMVRHRANHLNVAYAPDAATADKALLAKAALFQELGLRVHLCGDVTV